METGLVFGEWTVSARLGGGGNGDVWEVTSSRRPGKFAIKFLAVADQTDRLARFRDEVAFLAANPARLGILPLIDSSLDDEPLWYVMPRAERLQDVLAEARPEAIVEAVAAIAETLAQLASEGIGHRDIKPDNLFFLDGRPVIGDFGLVTYPLKDPVTAYAVKLGPTDHMAPEMRRNADTASHEPADVWSLAKTLWELLTRRHPLPGPHRPDDEAYAIQARMRLSCARDIDLLLSRATVIDPHKRISLAHFGHELRECLRTPEASLPASTGDLEQRITALTTYTYEQDEALADRRRAANDAFRSLQAVLGDAYHALAHPLKHFRGGYGNNVTDALGQMGMGPAMPVAGYGWGGRYSFTVGQVTAMVDLAVGMRLQTIDSPAQLFAIIRATERKGDLHYERYDWKLPGSAYVGSAAFRNYLEDTRKGFFSSFPPILAAVAEMFDGGEI